MSEKKDQIIENYVTQLTEKAGVKNVDMDLLLKCVNKLGPSIFNRDSSTVSTSDDRELERFKKKWLIEVLDFEWDDDLDGIISKAVEAYGGTSNSTKYRAVLYYLTAVQSNRVSKI